MYFTPDKQPTQKLQALIQDYFSGTNHAVCCQFLDALQHSAEIWDIGVSLLDAKAHFSTRFFGAVILHTALNSGSVPFAEENFGIICERLSVCIEDICATKRYEAVKSLMLLKQLFKVLAHLLFRAVNSWNSPVQSVIDRLKGLESTVGASSSGDTEVLDTNNVVICFLSILVEEFSSANLPFQTRQQVKQSILRDEALVFRIFEDVLTKQTNETILANALHCCSTWLSNMSTALSAVERFNFTRAIYQPMHRSELLFSVGLDCIINLLEEDVLGISSGCDTIHLLNFHVEKLAELQPLLLELVEAHSSAVRSGRCWEEFAQNEILSKMALLLSILTEKQMDNLWTRITQGKDRHSAVYTLFDMFLFPLLLTGHYPRDESVSDLGVQIWFNVIDALPASCEGSERNPSALSFSESIQCRFLNAAFVKSHYMLDLDTFFRIWQPEQRDQWYKLRSELADTLLAAYAHKQSLPFFVQLQERLGNWVDHYFAEEMSSDWQELEAILFVFNSISEQVVHEVAHQNAATSQLVSTVLAAIVRLVSRMTHNQTNSAAAVTVGHLLCCSMLMTLFRSFASFLEASTSLLLEGGIVDFVLSCLVNASQTKTYNTVTNMLASSALKTLQCFIQELPATLTLSERIISTLSLLSGKQSSLSAGVDWQLWNCIGLLLPFFGDNSCLVSTIGFRLEETKRNLRCRVNGQAGKSMSHLSKKPHTSADALLKPFVELFRGVSKTLNRTDSSESVDTPSFHLPSIDERQTRENVSQIILQLVACLTESFVNEGCQVDEEFVELFTQLLQSGFTTCFSSTANNSTPTILQDSLLERTVELTSHLVNSSANQLQPCLLEFAWLVIDTLLRDLQLEPRFAVGLRLLGTVLQHMDTTFTHLAVTALPKGSDSSLDFGSESCMQHPFPPILMGLKAHDITDQIEAYAVFIHHILDWQKRNKESNVEYVCRTCLLITYETFVGDSTALFWRLSFTASFAGLCLPEWNTVECCIQLCQRLLSRLSNDNHGHLLPKIITPDFLFELHAGVLLVLAKGALPRRLVNKYADLYASLCIYFPDKQFALLRTLLRCTEDLSEWSVFVSHTPHHQSVTMAVLNSVARTSLAQRDSFIRCVTRTAIPLTMIKAAISAFTTACNIENQ